MVATLELTDGTNTIDFMGSTYTATRVAGLGMMHTPQRSTINANMLSNIDYAPRTVTFSVAIKGTSQANLTYLIRSLQRMLVTAGDRQIIGPQSWYGSGQAVELKAQQGNTDADDVTFKVLTGWFDPSGTLLDQDRVGSSFVTEGIVTLITEPFGRLPPLFSNRRVISTEVDLAGTPPTTFGSLQNYIDFATQWGYSFDFDGAASKAQVADDSSIQNWFDGGGHIRMIVNLDSAGEGNVGTLMEKGKSANKGFELACFDPSSTGTKLKFTVQFDNTDGVWTTPECLTFGEIHVVEVDYNNSSVSNNPTIEIDGSSVTITEATTPVGTRVSDSGEVLCFGGDSAVGSVMDGKIYEVGVYGASGITDAIDRPLRNSESNLISYWPFIEASGTSIYDYNPSRNNHATITAGSGAWYIEDHIAGATHGALTEIAMYNNSWTDATGTGNFFLGVRSGVNRHNQTLFFQNCDSVIEGTSPSNTATNETFSGGTTSGTASLASGGSSARMRWEFDVNTSGRTLKTALTRIGNFRCKVQSTSDHDSMPRGLFRVLARARPSEGMSDATMTNAMMGLGLGWTYQGTSSIPQTTDAVVMFPHTTAQWYTLDLGEIRLPPISTLDTQETGYPREFDDGFVYIDCHWILDVTGTVDRNTDGEGLECDFDSIFLLPIDESACIVEGATTAGDDVYPVVSSMAMTPGAYAVDSNDDMVRLDAFTGAPLILPNAVSRFYIHRSDVGDPTAADSDIYITVVPLVGGI
jgi:hypothetical protein